MIEGRSSKSAIFLLRRLIYQCYISNERYFFLYLLIYLNLRINVKLENGILKSNFLTFIF